MGVVFFLGFAVILLVLALLFIAACIALIVIWIVRNCKGKKPRKWRLIVPICVLAFNTIITLLPIGFIAFSHKGNVKEIDLAESGTLIYWPEDGVEWFELGDKKYVHLNMLANQEDLGEPVANITYDHSSEFNPIYEFMCILGTGKPSFYYNMEAIYPVINDDGFDLLYVCGSMYCEEGTVEAAKDFYNALPPFSDDEQE